MFQLIELLAKKTQLGAFFFGLLTSLSYPEHLFWESEEQLTFRLRCIRKNKKGWTPQVEQIFLDYNNFTNQKSKADDNGKRTVLLQALKKSPYIEIIKDKSSPDEKICCFTKKFVVLLSRSMQTIREQASTVPVESALPELNALNYLEENQISLYSEDGITNPSTPDIGGNSTETGLSSSFLADEERSVDLTSVNDFLENFFTPSDFPNLPNTMQQSSDNGSVAAHSGSIIGNGSILEQADTVPTDRDVPQTNVTDPAEDSRLTLYSEDSNCVQLSSGGHSSETEQSLFLSGESSAAFSSSYDSSHGSVTSPNFLNVDYNAQSSASEMFQIHRVSMEGERVRILGEVDPSSPLPPSDHFMVTLRGAATPQ